MQGAADAREAYSSENLDENEAYQYAALRNILYRKGKVTEILVNYEQVCNILTNGGNNYTANQKEKT